uniref:Methionyl-tRNA formyltransferase n=1 Tax=uncultured Alphaproteobacteria bacterium TaxID=91750 RepID=A0A6G8F222_9PROT|nr:methionyl-tRNA formyltransferase [uncultured Alphaproteobacteria bacterium]
MKIVFMGTPEFALEALKALATEHEIAAVYTKEPKVSGRGNKLVKTPVHLWAEERGIEVRTPKTLRNAEEQERFAALKADVAVVAAYGLILPQPVLDAYPMGCINIHASLLPRWRGAAPIQRSIEAGDEKSGVTIMKVAAGLDTGEMLLKGEVAITPQTTGGDLHDELARIGADLVLETLRKWSDIVPEKQNDALSCYAAKIEKGESLLDFSLSAEVLCRKIMAFSPYPAVYFEHNGERFKVLRARVAEERVSVGSICQKGNRLFIGAINGAVEVLEIQRQGKKAMPTEELLRGYVF